jgi:serine/threonine protein kinase
MPIPPSEWARANDIFHRAVLLPETARHAFIVRECQGDAETLCRSGITRSIPPGHDGDVCAVPRFLSATSLGVYDIVEFIAAGGMGEVYRARDTRLKRDVALKVLPESFAGDRERLARFQREAKFSASLNHPNIAAIYGFESRRTVQALVLELVEGRHSPIGSRRARFRSTSAADSRADRRGVGGGARARDHPPRPEAGQHQGAPDGTVKVLDFGLAKALEPASTATRRRHVADDYCARDDDRHRRAARARLRT